MSENPYEYREDHCDSRSIALGDGSACRFPETPFVISLRYRRQPCTLTVFSDHLLIAGEKLNEPIRVERTEMLRFRFWSFTYSGNLTLTFRNRKLKLKVRRESQIFLKLGWLETWSQRIADPLEAVEKARQKSENMILLLGCQFTFYAAEFFSRILVSDRPGIVFGHLPVTSCLFLLSPFCCFYSFWGLMQRSRSGLWPVPVMLGGFIISLTNDAVQAHFRYSLSTAEQNTLFRIFCGLGFVSIAILVLFGMGYYLPYRRLRRLDLQIRETQDED
jgi:hypothetical protein